MLPILTEFALALLSLNAPHRVSVLQCNADPSGHRDSTAAFAKCLASNPRGDLLIPAGKYRITGTIVKNRNQNLLGMGDKASVLQCESQTAPCLVAADTAGENNYSVSSIENLGLEGPGPNTGSVGVYLGADPAGIISSPKAFADSVNLVGLRVARFGAGIEWGSNSYINKIVRCLILANGLGLSVPAGVRNSGEAIGITDSAIFNNHQSGIEDHGNFEWMIQDTSFDYNNTAIQFYGATIHAVNCHFEQQHAPVFFEPWGFGDISIRDTEILIQSPTGGDKYIFDTWPQSLHLLIDNVTVWSNHPVQYFVRARGNVQGSITNLHGNANKKIAAFSDGEGQAMFKSSEAFQP